MKSRPRIGTVGEFKFVVAAEHAIDFATGGMPTVLSTPRLVGLIERTARESLYPFLEDGERTVGAEIEIRHLAPTPLGQQVTITTRVIHTEAKLVDFQFEVRDQHEVVARGLHKRAVITVESFARRVAKKSGH
ncbi:MAG TPA: thioesterase family protein [Methylomirabilota bacterium]|nr:thioesterase family protein [Methylomirabilota bacterium]